MIVKYISYTKYSVANFLYTKYIEVIYLDKSEMGIQILRKMKKIMFLLKQNADNEFKKVNLTEPQGMLIRCLAHNGEMRISDLSKKLDLSNSTVSGIVDRLEKNGFVKRERSKEDRRVVNISLNKDYKNITKNFLKKIHNKLEGMMCKESEEDLLAILNALEKLQSILSNEEMNDDCNEGEEKCLN